ncbi:sulfotransferase domain-containing protein [Desulfosediminicola flagellatus]|uniref:sulfotransferase domain-containing protein n=1 Tax=Desulfosediminicola flagellatus TaxID=2569541 RepID=UPI0010AB630A|nr:sulfotransferase domain-containing protein [Desulfosediminicola flagellatus]
MNKIRSLFEKILSPKESSSVSCADVFLVSFPKSGNTWMRFLLSNLLKDNENEKINFYNVHDFCPEWEKRKCENKRLTCPQIYKSHSSYDKNFQKVIYIVRDPRDVYISYYHFMKKTIPLSWDLAAFIEKYDGPYGTWSNHVLSWIGEKRPNVIVIKYEDLLLNTYNVLLKVLKFSGIQVNEDRIRKAIKQSSFESMSKIERDEGRKYGDGETVFVRKGRSGQWRDVFGDKELVAFHKKEDCTLIQMLSYDID